MAYCTTAEVQTRAGGKEKLIQLSDVSSAGAVGTAEVESAIEEADGIIDSYVGKRWRTPLAEPVSAAIKWASARMAVLILKQRRTMFGSEDADAWDREVEGLQAIGSGANLPAPTDATTEASPLVVDHHHAPHDVKVSRGKTKGFW